LIKIFII